MKKLVFVCLGNICRSPMAEFVMKSMTDHYEIQSRATSSWEHGNPIHKGTQGIFQQYQIPYEMCPADCKDKIYSFASESVPDPWYTGDFEETYQRVQEGCQAWLERLEKESKDGKS